MPEVYMTTARENEQTTNCYSLFDQIRHSYAANLYLTCLITFCIALPAFIFILINLFILYKIGFYSRPTLRENRRTLVTNNSIYLNNNNRLKILSSKRLSSLANQRLIKTFTYLGTLFVYAWLPYALYIYVNYLYSSDYIHYLFDLIFKFSICFNFLAYIMWNYGFKNYIINSIFKKHKI